MTFLLGRTLHPYAVGEVAGLVRKQLAPKDPVLPPEEGFAYPGMTDFNEDSLYREWMR